MSMNNNQTAVYTPLTPGSHYFFCGIGGAGMNPLAHILAARGMCVSGSDCRESDVLDALRAHGITCFAGHDSSQLSSADVFVSSSAIASDNPELLAAREKGIPCVHRSDVLATLVNHARGVAVAGTHGKTTVSALTAILFARGGADPTAVIGGFVPEFNAFYRNGASDWMIVETDESDGSFQKIESEIAVVLNIDSDHLDYYDDIDNIVRAFSVFCSKVKPVGTLVFNQDAACVADAISSAPESVARISCSSKGQADFRAHSIVYSPWSSQFVVGEGELEYEIELGIPGRHNVMNALQAVAAARSASIGIEAIREGCRVFHGVHRRFQVLGTYEGATVIDDYAHHPREIAATIATAAALGSRCLVVFQPHRYSRTAKLFDEFTDVLSGIERLILTDIYSASETAEAVSGRTLYDRIRLQNNAVVYCEDIEKVPQAVASRVQAGDIILFLGAGSLSQIAHQMVENKHTGVA